MTIAARARTRAREIVCVFVAVQLLIVVMGALGLEGINILRSYAAGESHWSKGQKSAILGLSRFAETREARDYRQFERGLAVIRGDRIARETLQRVRGFGAASERAQAERGFVQGGNDPADAPGLVWGFLLFHNWPTFDTAVNYWTRGDNRAGQLQALGEQMRAAAARGASRAEMTDYLKRIAGFDGGLSASANGYAMSMARASRIAEQVTLALFVLLSAIACAVGVAFIRRIAHNGAEAEIRAAESEARVRDFAELATDWFCELDRDLRVGFVASRAQSAVGDNLPIEGRDWIELGKASGYKPQAAGEHRGALDERVAFRGHRFQQTLPDGGLRHWSVSGKPLFAQNGAFAGFRVTGTEISDMIAIQEDLKRARDEAMRANKAKSAFLANMSHELRTPLNAILGFSGFIEHEAMGEIANKRYVEYAGDIRESGEHLLAIINDLLEHSRIEAGKSELRESHFDLAAAIEQARLFCEPRAEQANVIVRARIAQKLPPVLGDELRIRQVLINLVSNAVKFTPGGTVDIAARTDGAGNLRIDVRDTGIGMDKAGIDQALQPFGQVDNGLSRKFEGTGLGLPLAKSLVELHGGTLSILSEQGSGTVVSVVLPAWRMGQPASDPVVAA